MVTESAQEVAARVREAVSRTTGRDASGWPVRRLAGHASMRSYWRVGAPPDSRVVMVMPPDARPEEVTSGGPPPEDPFVNVQRYLARTGVRVPAIHAFLEPERLMVLEDLGDEMLETRLLAGDPAGPLYERAVDQLARLRARSERAPDPGCVAFGRSFDQALYRWELDHFREWLLEAWKGAVLSPAERPEVDRTFDAIAAALAAEPAGFTHRDYQSRNLMVLPGGEQAVIDFQDALLAPRQYDLVALLRDSYVELPPELVDGMLARYLARLEAEGGPRLDPVAFRATFDLLTVQRKLKDAGRFVFIDRVRGNPGFLPSIPASLRYVREALGTAAGARGAAGDPRAARPRAGLTGLVGRGPSVVPAGPGGPRRWGSLVLRVRVASPLGAPRPRSAGTAGSRRKSDASASRPRRPGTSRRSLRMRPAPRPPGRRVAPRRGTRPAWRRRAPRRGSSARWTSRIADDAPRRATTSDTATASAPASPSGPPVGSRRGSRRDELPAGRVETRAARAGGPRRQTAGACPGPEDSQRGAARPTRRRHPGRPPRRRPAGRYSAPTPR